MKPIDRAQVLKLSEEGQSIPTIAKTLRCSERTIQNIRKNAGFRSGYFLTPERLQHLQQLLNDGWSFNEIHRTEGTDPGTLSRHFPGQGWTAAQNGRFNAHTRNTRPVLGRPA